MSLLLALAAVAQPTPPTPERPLAGNFSSADYPRAALVAGAEGRTRFRLSIDAEGRVTACDIAESSGHVSLDGATCLVLRQRARFRPARDRRGRAVPGTHQGAVLWRLPRIAFAPFVRTVAVTRLINTARCARSDGDQPVDTLVGEECERTAGPVARLVQRAGPDWRGTIRESMWPEGQAAPIRGAGRLYEAEAELVIAADGRVERCEVIRIERWGPLAAHLPEPNVCRGPTSPGSRFEPAPGGEVRRARLLFSVDLDRDDTGAPGTRE